MQFCRGYYKSVCGLAHKSARACLSAEGNDVSARRCTFCANFQWSRTDSRTFATSSYVLAARKNTKTKEIHDKNKSEVESSKIENNVDFFGFEGGPGVIDFETEPATAVKPDDKYHFLIKPQPEKHEDVTYEATFGTLRYDSDNIPRREKKPVSVDEIELNARMQTDFMANSQQTTTFSELIDGLHFQSAHTQISTKNDTQKEPSEQDSTGVQPNLIEEQFFGSDGLQFQPAHTQIRHQKELSEQDSTRVQPNFLEEQFFGGAENLQPEFESPLKSTMTVHDRKRRDTSNVIEEQYFPSDSSAETEHPSSESAEFGLPGAEENHIEAQYFGRGTSEIANHAPVGTMEERHRKLKGNASKDSKAIDERDRNGEDAIATSGPPAPMIGHREAGKKSADRKLSDEKKDDKEATEKEVVHTGLRKPRFGTKIVADIENPKTAYDYAIKLRRERKANNFSSSTDSSGAGIAEAQKPNHKVDSFGFRVFSDQVVELEKLPEYLVLKNLADAALYNENDILALSKPYGMPVHPGAGHRHCLTKYLPDLAKQFCVGYEHQELYTVHRLDKETTGVILLAKTQEMAKRLSDMFAEGEIKKTYWALTKGTPSPLEGIIDIPIAEAVVAGKLKMVLQPHFTERMKVVMRKSSIKSQNAVTHFKVLGSNFNAALVELSPSTGVKHQLRVHLSSALCCPVLGDHKYSHMSKLAPQRLPSDMLQRLGVRQSKVRTLPMHLHARGVVLPQFVDGRNIIIGARLPLHFKQNMHRLKIKDEREHK